VKRAALKILREIAREGGEGVRIMTREGLISKLITSGLHEEVMDIMDVLDMIGSMVAVGGEMVEDLVGQNGVEVLSTILLQSTRMRVTQGILKILLMLAHSLEGVGQMLAQPGLVKQLVKLSDSEGVDSNRAVRELEASALLVIQELALIPASQEEFRKAAVIGPLMRLLASDHPRAIKRAVLSTIRTLSFRDRLFWDELVGRLTMLVECLQWSDAEASIALSILVTVTDGNVAAQRSLVALDVPQVLVQMIQENPEVCSLMGQAAVLLGRIYNCS
jgi:hypothetical protein